MLRKGDLADAALAFAIWRAATQANWDCTYRQIAEAIGVPHHRVAAAVRARGWAKKFAPESEFTRVAKSEAQAFHPSFAVDTFMRVNINRGISFSRRTTT